MAIDKVVVGNATKASDINEIIPDISTKTSDYTITDTDDFTHFIANPASTGNVNFTLPTASANENRVISFINKAASSGSMTITPEGSETLNGGTAQSCYQQYNRVDVISDGSEWFITSCNIGYDTGWVNVADWQNVNISTDGSTTGNIIHNLNASGLNGLNILFVISTDGTDANSFYGEQYSNNTDSWQFGVGVHYVDVNNIIIHTNVNGLYYVPTSGNSVNITTQDWYYKVIVKKVI
jgi:hypothetical protein